MKILVIGGMHGNELLGIELVTLLQKMPISNVDCIFANKQAIEQNVRFVDQDLNRSFPGSNVGSNYEQQRAAWIIKKAKKYDIVLDFHNTYCPDNDCGFIGEDSDSVLMDVAGLLGLKRVIVADYDCLNKYAPNCLSIEISLDSTSNNPLMWYDRILLLSRLKTFKTCEPIDLFRFVYRMSIEDRDTYDLTNQQLKAFKAMSPNLAKNLGVKSPAYPIFIGDSFTPYNYGGILNKIT